MKKFKRGDSVRKVGGSAWLGTVVGEYSTTLTPEGYAVESLAHPGSVQIYPAKALELVPGAPPVGPVWLADVDLAMAFHSASSAQAGFRAVQEAVLRENGLVP